MTTESDIVKHVQKHALFYPALDGEPYSVEYEGKTYYANGTRGLVLKICKNLEIPMGA